LNLPTAQASTRATSPKALRLSVDEQGSLALDGQTMSAEALKLRLQEQVRQEPQPALQVLGDKSVPYEHVARALALVKEVGLQKIALMTDRQP